MGGLVTAHINKRGRCLRKEENVNLKEKIVRAICECPVSPLAREESARLIEAWIAEADSWADTHYHTLAVECPWYIQLDTSIYIVGVIDRIASDGEGMLLQEWKTRRAPKIKKDGAPYKGDTEDEWRMEIRRGPQLAVYALAARGGQFSLGSVLPVLPNKSWISPYVFARAILKSTPPAFWSGTFEFSPERLDATRNALLVKAHQIRVARKLGVVPWQMTGNQCIQYGSPCEYLEPICSKQLYPPLERKGRFHPEDKSPDPGYKICDLLGLDPNDPELVVLSQSAYTEFSTCMEKGRIHQNEHVPVETSFELDIGSAFHAALAEFYRFETIRRLGEAAQNTLTKFYEFPF